MKFDVHLYAVVRVKVTGIEADSHREAALRAEAAVDLDRLLETCQPPDPLESISDADEIVGFMVDQVEPPSAVATHSFDYRGTDLVQSW